MLKLLDNEMAFGRIGINYFIRNRFFRNGRNRLSMAILHMESLGGGGNKCFRIEV